MKHVKVILGVRKVSTADFAALQMIVRYVEKYYSLRSKRSFSTALQH